MYVLAAVFCDMCDTVICSSERMALADLPFSAHVCPHHNPGFAEDEIVAAKDAAINYLPSGWGDLWRRQGHSPSWYRWDRTTWTRAVTGGGSVAIDRYGNVGLYSHGGGGAGLGAYVGGGASGQVSNADGISNLSGTFENASGSVGPTTRKTANREIHSGTPILRDDETFVVWRDR